MHSTRSVNLSSSEHLVIVILREEYKIWSSSLDSLLQSPITSAVIRPNILLSTFSNTLFSCDSVLHAYIGNFFVIVNGCFPYSLARKEEVQTSHYKVLNAYRDQNTQENQPKAWCIYVAR